MVEINKKIFQGLIKEGFFDDWKNIKDITKKLSQLGFTVDGKKVSRISQTFTFLCRGKDLFREELSSNQIHEFGRWKYKRRIESKEVLNRRFEPLKLDIHYPGSAMEADENYYWNSYHYKLPDGKIVRIEIGTPKSKFGGLAEVKCFIET